MTLLKVISVLVTLIRSSPVFAATPTHPNLVFIPGEGHGWSSASELAINPFPDNEAVETKTLVWYIFH